MNYQITNKLFSVKLALFGLDGIRVLKHHDLLWQEIDKLSRSLRKQYNLKGINQLSSVVSVREMFKLEGVDPTRYRPSSEALLRRIVKGQGLYKVNSVVDVNNWCSLEFLLPMGVYDAGKIKGNVLTFRHGNQGEQYKGIGKEKQNAEGKIIMLDEEKICGGPVADSKETMITLNTKNILMVIYAPQTYTQESLKSSVDTSIQRMTKYNEGKLVFETTTVL